MISRDQAPGKKKLLMTEEELEVLWQLRRQTDRMDKGEVLQTLLKQIKNTKSNSELINALREIL